MLDLGPIPELNQITYEVAIRPPVNRFEAWGKLEECERRLVLARWAMSGTDPVTGKNQVLASDLVIAYFYSLEATIQVLKEEVEKAAKNRFERWIKSQKYNSIEIKALRTLRTLAVHVLEIAPESKLEIPISPRPNQPFVLRRWSLPEIEPNHLRALHSPKISEAELPTWNQVRLDASKVLVQSLNDLTNLLNDAEVTF